MTHYQLGEREFHRHHRGSTERPVNDKAHHNGSEGITQNYGYVTL